MIRSLSPMKRYLEERLRLAHKQGDENLIAELVHVEMEVERISVNELVSMVSVLGAGSAHVLVLKQDGQFLPRISFQEISPAGVTFCPCARPLLKKPGADLRAFSFLNARLAGFGWA